MSGLRSSTELFLRCMSALALNFVVRKEAPLGIVYRSDAVSEKRVRTIGMFSESTHPPIVYPVALLKGGDTEASRRLLDLLKSDACGRNLHSIRL